MPAPTLPLEGGCRCGRVRFRISAPPILTMACHCIGCQKMTASAFSCTAVIPSQGFEIVGGEPVIGGLHGSDAHHFHCPHCKSWMFTRAEGMDWFVNIRPTMLDDATWFSPYIETYTSEKLPWARTPAVHSFEKFPPFETYEALAKEFAGQA
jgi:hypothetical protein